MLAVHKTAAWFPVVATIQDNQKRPHRAHEHRKTVLLSRQAESQRGVIRKLVLVLFPSWCFQSQKQAWQLCSPRRDFEGEHLLKTCLSTVTSTAHRAASDRRVQKNCRALRLGWCRVVHSRFESTAPRAECVLEPCSFQIPEMRAEAQAKLHDQLCRCW